MGCKGRTTVKYACAKSYPRAWPLDETREIRLCGHTHPGSYNHGSAIVISECPGERRLVAGLSKVSDKIEDSDATSGRGGAQVIICRGRRQQQTGPGASVLELNPIAKRDSAARHSLAGYEIGVLPAKRAGTRRTALACPWPTFGRGTFAAWYNCCDNDLCTCAW
jgi:hypothetical protein